MAGGGGARAVTARLAGSTAGRGAGTVTKRRSGGPGESGSAPGWLPLSLFPGCRPSENTCRAPFRGSSPPPAHPGHRKSFFSWPHGRPVGQTQTAWPPLRRTLEKSLRRCQKRWDLQWERGGGLGAPAGQGRGRGRSVRPRDGSAASWRGDVQK